MKIKIGPYTTWIGPYQIAEKILFWKDKSKDHSVHEFGTWLSGGEVGDSVLMKLCIWIESKKKRKIKIKIDKWDTWGMDSTLALIILPMLIQLRDTKHGSAMIDDEDLPIDMRVHGFGESVQFELEFETHDADETLSWNTYETKWDWVLNEMIWSFEQLQPDNDWEDQYWNVRPELDLTKYPEDKDVIAVPVRWKTKGVHDYDGRNAHQARISNGLKLFGKYFQGLWD